MQKNGKNMILSVLLGLDLVVLLVAVDNKVLADLKIYFLSLVVADKEIIHKILILISEIFLVDEWDSDRNGELLLARTFLIPQNQNQRNRLLMLQKR